MSIDSISSATLGQVSGGVQSPAALSRFNDLTQAIESGDLAQAGKDFGSLQQIQNSQLATSDEDGGAVKAAFARVGNAIRSGDVSGAKDALSTLKQATRKAHRTGSRHRHHEAPKASATVPPTSTTRSAAATASGLGVLAQTVDTIA